MVRGILFDLGGTLYSYDGLERSTRTILEKLALELRLQHDPQSIFEHYVKASVAADQIYAHKPFYLFRDYFLTVFEALLERLDRTHMRHHFGWFEEYQRVVLTSSMRLKEDCHETLARLRADGLYLSVVSNADDNMLDPLIARADLARYLDHWTSSETARSCKPDRRFFELALQKSGLQTHEVLFVGDSLEQDIQGAHAAGMRTVLIAEFDRPAPMHVGRPTVDPDFRISRLAMLPQIIGLL